MKRRSLRIAAGAALLVILCGLWVVGLALSRSRLESPGPSHLLLDREGRFLGEVAATEASEFGYWPLEELPPRVVAATLVPEDRRFWSHPGIDAVAMTRALWQNVRGGQRVSGASTIAMQVARLQRPGRKSDSTLRFLAWAL